jgi:ketosteroid isomerase-like protein
VAVGLLSLFFTSLPAWSDDMDDLKATFEQMIKALNTRDLEALLALSHEQSVSFGVTTPFAIDGKAASRQANQASFTNNESIMNTPINPQFRVIGSTGLCWGNMATAFKPKDGPLQTVYVRYLWTFVKENGKWLRVANHLSRMPSGN